MNDKETIRDMQKIMEYCCNVYDNKGNHIRNKCNTYDCEYFCETNNVCCSFRLKEATALYNAGYRKIPEGSVVLTREEYNEIKQYQSCITKIEKAFDKVHNNARKETAKEIINMLIPDCQNCDEDWHRGCLCLRETIAEKITNKYGVEVEE